MKKVKLGFLEGKAFSEDEVENWIFKYGIREAVYKSKEVIKFIEELNLKYPKKDKDDFLDGMMLAYKDFVERHKE